MKTHFTLNVPTPCHEDWNSFTPTQKGKFCGACQKEVIDFTRWTDDEIKDYFKSTRSNSTCGRFIPQQLKTYLADKPTSSHSTYAAFIAFLMLLVTEPAEAQINPRQERQEQVDERKKEIKPKGPITVSGIVIYDADSTALPGVNVVRKNTTEGTVTDAEGRFQITINSPLDPDSLEFSFIGFKTTTISITPDLGISNLKIVMTADLSALGEVVVVGGVCAVRWYGPRNWWWKLKGLFRRY